MEKSPRSMKNLYSSDPLSSLSLSSRGLLGTCFCIETVILVYISGDFSASSSLIKIFQIDLGVYRLNLTSIYLRLP